MTHLLPLSLTNIASPVVWLFLVIAVVSQIIWNFVECFPFALNWSYNNGECSATQAQFAYIWCFHLFTDILVYIIPFFIIRNLKNLNRRQESKLGCSSGLVSSTFC